MRKEDVKNYFPDYQEANYLDFLFNYCILLLVFNLRGAHPCLVERSLHRLGISLAGVVMSKPPLQQLPVELKALTLEEDLFVTRFLANGTDRIKAYQSIHPGCKYGTAATAAYRLLKKPYIQAEVRRRMRYEQGVTKEWGEHSLMSYKEQADAVGDFLGGASIVMDCMKLSGHLVERREVKTISDEQQRAVRQLVASALSSPLGGLGGVLVRKCIEDTQIEKTLLAENSPPTLHEN